jgi:xanthosine utilization system XapX-like protein
MTTPEDLRMFFAEHAQQARKHEEQREKATNIILSITAALTGLVTFAKLSIWSLPAALAIAILGVFGFFFCGKHYERARMHTEILRQIRLEIDGAGSVRRNLTELSQVGRQAHYKQFTWPNARADDVNHREAKSWIARQRLNVFWELLHALVVLIGVSLVSAIIMTAHLPRDDVQKIEIVQHASPSATPSQATSSPHRP